MNEDLLKENLPWADKYRITLKNKGIDDKYALWYLRRADAFMKEVGYSDPGDATREVVEGYFSELSNRYGDATFPPPSMPESACYRPFLG